MEVEGKQNSLFPSGKVISVSLDISQLKNRKKIKRTGKKSFAKRKVAHKFHLRVQSSSFCFARDLVIIIGPR